MGKSGLNSRPASAATTPPEQGDRIMSTKTKVAVAAVVLLSSSAAAIARYDGDANPVPGAHQRGVLINRAPSAFHGVFAAARPAVRAPRRQLDGDGNPVPGGRV
jgi:hypothetical protein